VQAIGTRIRLKILVNLKVPGFPDICGSPYGSYDGVGDLRLNYNIKFPKY